MVAPRKYEGPAPYYIDRSGKGYKYSLEDRIRRVEGGNYSKDGVPNTKHEYYENPNIASSYFDFEPEKLSDNGSNVRNTLGVYGAGIDQKKIPHGKSDLHNANMSVSRCRELCDAFQLHCAAFTYESAAPAPAGLVDDKGNPVDENTLLPKCSLKTLNPAMFDFATERQDDSNLWVKKPYLNNHETSLTVFYLYREVKSKNDHPEA